MKNNVTILFLLLSAISVALCSEDISEDVEGEVEVSEAITRQVRQANAEEMVDNILQWLQDVYTKRNRKARQGGPYQYLPPGGNNAERPRPFQPAPSSTQRPYKPYEPPVSSSTPYQPPTYDGPSSSAPYQPSSQGYPDYSQSGYPATGASPNPPFVSPETSYLPAGGSPPTPRPSVGYPSGRPDEGSSPFQPGSTGYQPIPTQPPPRPSSTPGYQPPSSTYRPQPSSPSTSGYRPPPSSTYRPSSTPDYPSSTYRPSPTTPGGIIDDDDKHPPHIHAIDVQCAKDMMTINLEFNKVYNGIIYSKGYFSNPNCRYVQENSGRIKYSFTLSLNSCGTEFVNGFETQGQSYLENVLVFQNEAGIQEVWDSIRSVRCLWEGNINKQVSIALSVGMLNQEVVTFSGDTAMASLDIQLGRGPFAPPANGLVKIGETMTLVVSITGDPGFDIQVKDCIARDSTSTNVVALTDDQGCVLKPKVFGAFQKTRDTGNTGTSIIAYAFFNAFKFPDVMDLILECNVELCKVNCEMCPNPNQKLEPGRRRRRDVSSGNDTLSEPVLVGKHLRVILPEDLAVAAEQQLGVCLSHAGFLYGAAFILVVLMVSCVSAGCMWLKLQRHAHCKHHS